MLMVADRSPVFEHLEVFVALSWVVGWVGLRFLACMICMSFIVIVEVDVDHAAVAMWDWGSVPLRIEFCFFLNDSDATCASSPVYLTALRHLFDKSWFA